MTETDDLRTELASAVAQLPDGMKHCTIVAKECAKGHGWLTAANWQPFDCPTCALAAAVAAREEAERERDEALLTVKALTPAANYCLEYKPLLLAAEARAERLMDLVRFQRAELHDAGLLTDEEYAALADAKGSPDRLRGYDALRASNAALTERIALDNAVCLCGCPAGDHEDLGEDGEQCEHEDHECLRVAPAVLAAMQAERASNAAMREALQNIVEETTDETALTIATVALARAAEASPSASDGGGGDR